MAKVLIDNKSERKPLLKRELKIFEHHWHRFALEIALFLVFFGWNLSIAILPSELSKQMCLIRNFEAYECSGLDGKNGSKEIGEYVQPYVAQILNLTTFLTSFVPGVMSLFLGPWTDKFGRKKVICATFFGHSFSLAALAIVSMIFEHYKMTNLWIYVFAYIPMISTGGSRSMHLAIFCYISDVTDDINRSSRLMLIEFIVFLGKLTATVSSKYILKITSAATIFQISTVFVSLASIYAISHVQESVTLREDVSFNDQLKELFSMTPIKETIKTCLKRRGLNERKIFWSLLVILMLYDFTVNGISPLINIFVEEKFQWTIQESTLFESASFIISIIGSFVCLVVLKKVFQFSDMSLAILAGFSMMADSTMKSLAQSGFQMYLTSGLCIFKLLNQPMCRSLIASVISNSELGKVYSIASFLESFVSIIAPPLYTFVYTMTSTRFAGTFYLFTACINLVSLVLIYSIKRMNQSGYF